MAKTRYLEVELISCTHDLWKEASMISFSKIGERACISTEDGDVMCSPLEDIIEENGNITFITMCNTYVFKIIEDVTDLM